MSVKILADAPLLAPDPTPEPAPVSPGSGRRRSAREWSGVELKLTSLATGALLGMAGGVLARAALRLGGMGDQVSATTLGLVGPLMGVTACLVYARLMEEARDGTVHAMVDGVRRTFPCRRRSEVVRRATLYLVSAVTLLGALIAGGVYLYWNVSPVDVPLPRPRPELAAYGVVLVAVLSVMALGEVLYRLTAKEGRTTHAPWMLLPAVTALGLPLAGLFG